MKAPRLATWTRNILLAVGAFVVLGVSHRFDVLIGFIPIGWLVSIFVHELGHALGAELVGWRVWIFCIGRVLLRLRPLTVSLTKNGDDRDDAYGFVFATPKDAESNTAAKDLLVTLGGPLANFAFGAALIAVAYLLGQTGPSPPPPSTLAITWGLGIWSSAFAIYTFIPWHGRRGLPNDGAKIQIALRRRRQPKGVHLLYLRALSDFGIPIHVWDEWLRHTYEARDFGIGKVYPRFLEALERDDTAEAKKLLSKLRELLPGETAVMDAYLSVAVDGDARTAEDILSHAVAPRDLPESENIRQVALCQILALEGEAEAAAAKLDAVENNLGEGHTLVKALVARTRARWVAS